MLPTVAEKTLRRIIAIISQSQPPAQPLSPLSHTNPVPKMLCHCVTFWCNNLVSRVALSGGGGGGNGGIGLGRGDGVARGGMWQRCALK